MRSSISWVCRLLAVSMAIGLPATSAKPTVRDSPGLKVRLSFADGLLNGSTDGRIMVMFAPAGVDPLDDTDVTTSPNKFFGKNAYDLSPGNTFTLSGGNTHHTSTGVWGFPNVSLNDIEPGKYSVQAFLTPYETVTRSDGSQVSVHFPCGDGAPPVNGVGSMTTTATDLEVKGGRQTIQLTFDNITQADPLEGTEIGGCSQGNYADTELLKYVKIRSEKLSEFWNRDMFVGAVVRLPSGYDASDNSTKYPVVYSQDHWSGSEGAFQNFDDNFVANWESGIIPGVNGTADRETPKMILIKFRHENPFYDDSYAVNTANLGPWGDAINDELIPLLDSMFNTIAEPYARIQEGGSTGGWESAANVVFRPDLFGACFSSYPDSLDFHKHQAIPLYTSKSAYVEENGESITSIREIVDGVDTNVTSVAQENHWELTYGTSTRSFLQWDIWFAVFGVQGYNNYPLEAWDKVTGEIYSEAVEFWKPMDLSNWITSNWDNSLNLGEVLRNRMFIYVGTWDNYFLNEGVEEFQKNVESKGGAGWANVSIVEGAEHGGVYEGRDVWDYLELLESWVKDHAPDGVTPLTDERTPASSRGNLWEDVLAHGGRQAAVERQASPELSSVHSYGAKSKIQGTVGRWDPGVSLEAQWSINGRLVGKAFDVKQGNTVTFTPQGGWGWNWRSGRLQLLVTGRKRNYQEETRKSNVVKVKR